MKEQWGTAFSPLSRENFNAARARARRFIPFRLWGGNFHIIQKHRAEFNPIIQPRELSINDGLEPARHPVVGDYQICHFNLLRYGGSTSARALEVHFPSMEALQKCAESAGGKETLANAVKISSGGPPVTLIAEEETFTF